MEIIKINAANNGYYDYSDKLNPKPKYEFLRLIAEENKKRNFEIKLIDFNNELLKNILKRYSNKLSKVIKINDITLKSDFLRIAYAFFNNKEIIYVDNDILLDDDLVSELLESNKPFYDYNFSFFHYLPERDYSLFKFIVDTISESELYPSDWDFLATHNLRSFCIGKGIPGHFTSYSYFSKDVEGPENIKESYFKFNNSI